VRVCMCREGGCGRSIFVRVCVCACVRACVRGGGGEVYTTDLVMKGNSPHEFIRVCVYVCVYVCVCTKCTEFMCVCMCACVRVCVPGGEGTTTIRSWPRNVMCNVRK